MPLTLGELREWGRASSLVDRNIYDTAAFLKLLEKISPTGIDIKAGRIPADAEVTLLRHFLDLPDVMRAPSISKKRREGRKLDEERILRTAGYLLLLFESRKEKQFTLEDLYPSDAGF